MIANIISVSLISLGLFFFFGTIVGVLRFPDFYTRMHAAGKGDTLSTLLMLLGCAVYTLNHGHWHLGAAFVAFKLMLIAKFIFIGSPTATHAMMDAGYETEVKHWVKEDDS